MRELNLGPLQEQVLLATMPSFQPQNNFLKNYQDMSHQSESLVYYAPLIFYAEDVVWSHLSPSEVPYIACQVSDYQVLLTKQHSRMDDLKCWIFWIQILSKQ